MSENGWYGTLLTERGITRGEVRRLFSPAISRFDRYYKTKYRDDYRVILQYFTMTHRRYLSASMDSTKQKSSIWITYCEQNAIFFFMLGHSWSWDPSAGMCKRDAAHQTFAGTNNFFIFLV
ncbi:hypothetical protein CAAN4_F05325 [[Candida] anglica]|uniref:Uncharacterized protein n=1 Tax=[Candida] anglica TaxID=148631 RepID=A0ABP0EGJ5_9ASCO